MSGPFGDTIRLSLPVASIYRSLPQWRTSQSALHTLPTHEVCHSCQNIHYLVGCLLSLQFLVLYISGIQTMKLVGILTSNVPPILDTKHIRKQKQNHFNPFSHNCNYSVMSTDYGHPFNTMPHLLVIYEHIFTSIYFHKIPFIHVTYSTILSRSKSYPISYPMSSNSLSS